MQPLFYPLSTGFSSQCYFSFRKNTHRILMRKHIKKKSPWLMWQGPAVSFRRRTPAMEGLIIVYAAAFTLHVGLLSITFRMLIRATIIWECPFQHRDYHPFLQDIFISPAARETRCVHWSQFCTDTEWSVGVSCSFPPSTAKFLVTNFIPSHWPETSTKYFSGGRDEPQVQGLLWCQGHSFILFLHILGFSSQVFPGTTAYTSGPTSLWTRTQRCADYEFRRFAGRL